VTTTRAVPMPASRAGPTPPDDRVIALIASGGRLAVVWLAATIVAAADRPLSTEGVLAVTLAAGVWHAALRSAFASLPYTLGILPTTAVGTVTGAVCVGAINPWLPALRLSALALLGAAIGIFCSVAVWEAVVDRVGRKRRVLVIGTGAFREIQQEMARSSRAPFQILGALGDDRPTDCDVVPALGPVDSLVDIVRAHRPAYIVLADEAAASATLDRLVEISDGGFRVASLTTFFEYAFGRVPLPHVTSGWFMGIVHLRHHAYAHWSKRAFDIVVATAGLVLAAPLLPLLVLLVKATPGPVIYRQTRLGARGRRFTIYKFRTMVDGAERGGAQWAADTDPRATAIGAFLRRTHLDELPQLVNVLRGEMSIVGPRPERPEFISMLEHEVPFWSRRLLIEPGLTGWAQVQCGYASSCATAADKLSYDFWYLRHRSVAVDIAVCARTLLLALPSCRPRPVSVGERAAP
jgi:exopolysaccharide biosynthesis polyprenyl glycosylphosphotransferase